jgi:endonuclease VIII
MPEGPEITITEQYLKTKIRKKLVESVEVLSGRYTHQNLKGLKLMNNAPLIVEELGSKGKLLWIRFTDVSGKTIFMLNTFGMTGRWSFNNNPSARLKLTIKSNTVQGKVYTLYYIDSRNFGTIEFTDDDSILNNKLDKLAPDVLKTDMTDNDLVNMIKRLIDKSTGTTIRSKKKNLNLVKVLMDQELLVSGIGNYLTAEILYDAKLNPHRDLKDLSDIEIKHLAHSIRRITKYAYYDNNSGYMEYFKIFMKTHSTRIDNGAFPNYHPDITSVKGFQFKVYQKPTDSSGHNVIRDEIIKGRTTHWVKEVQK